MDFASSGLSAIVVTGFGWKLRQKSSEWTFELRLFCLLLSSTSSKLESFLTDQSLTLILEQQQEFKAIIFDICVTA